MPIKSFSHIAAAALFSLSLTACDQFSSSPDTLVLDLDAIANATGKADIIKQQIDQANLELNTQLNTISQKLTEQLQAEKTKMGKKPAKQDEEKLQQMTLQANQKMQQARNIATQKAQQYRSSLIQQLRQQVSPIAESIARKKGANVVMITNNATLWYNPDADITGEVIAELRAIPAATENTTTKKTETPADSESTEVN